MIRSTDAEKLEQIENLSAFQLRNRDQIAAAQTRLRDVARRRDNVFDELLEAVKVCSLGQISAALYDVGGQYRRNL